MQIVDFFYELSRQHTRIKAFYYGKAYEKGAGNSIYPLVWLDDPILFRTSGNNLLQYTANVDILGRPVDAADVLTAQSSAFLIGLAFREKIIKQWGVSPGTVQDFSGMTLRDYYDDNAAGMRFTFSVNMVNPINRCADDFDPNKQFSTTDALPNFAVDHPDGCAVFGGDVLPNFEV